MKKFQSTIINLQTYYTQFKIWNICFPVVSGNKYVCHEQLVPAFSSSEVLKRDFVFFYTLTATLRLPCSKKQDHIVRKAFFFSKNSQLTGLQWNYYYGWLNFVWWSCY